ncbi:hypothetical protein CAEBREN_08933 [Caenorhabditis brenneri]|uniref:Uncharacterized protein n=1 Tax=Caenorhabditis brenneri TaxID=135651 RepID=G0MH52_CAEBE|nr:hypothetical protein CAEBREN_08933 [Caenorhabditis brenneri]
MKKTFKFSQFPRIPTTELQNFHFRDGVENIQFSTFFPFFS